MRTRAILIVAALCLATPANAKSWMRWDCGDDVTVTLGVSAPHQNALKREIHSIEIDGLRDPVKDHVNFKLVMPKTIAARLSLVSWWRKWRERRCQRRRWRQEHCARA
jgi:hypothetical protein